MKRQIRHMIKYRYVPFSLGKQVYHDLFDNFSVMRATCSILWSAFEMFSFAILNVSALQ